MPEIFEGFGESLRFYGAVGVARVLRKDELIVIAFGGEHLRHVLIGDDPVVHVVAHHIGIEKIAVAHFHP